MAAEFVTALSFLLLDDEAFAGAAACAAIGSSDAIAPAAVTLRLSRRLSRRPGKPIGSPEAKLYFIGVLVRLHARAACTMAPERSRRSLGAFAHRKTSDVSRRSMTLL